MAASATSPWADDLFDFAFVPGMDDRLKELAEQAEDEDWNYHHTSSEHPYPVLYNYIRFTYRRVAEESKIALSDDGQFSSFNTGLVTEKPGTPVCFISNQSPRRCPAMVLQGMVPTRPVGTQQVC